MAGIDLYGGDAQRIRDAYKPFRPQGPSDDEVTKWLSGSYGGGGINDWVRQIGESGEARQAQIQRPPQSPMPPVVGQNPESNRPYTPDFGAPTFAPGYGGPTFAPSGVDTSSDDPWARARRGIEATYLQATGRPAAPGDADKWLSGGYGYGSGLQDYDKFINAIMSSQEARNYRPPVTTPDNGYKTIEYWQQRGVPTIEMFDPFTGQLKAGWQRTINGYERTGGAPQTNGQGPQGGDIRAWLMSRLGSGPSSPEALAALESELSQRGIRLQKDSFGTIRGRIYLPNGNAVDVVNPNGWGQPWTWIDRGTGGGHAGGFGQGVGLPSSQYSDPHTKLLEELTLARIAALQSGQDPNLQRLMSFFEQRFGDLQGPGRTGAEQEVIRTQALDPIERDRAAARRRAMERISAMGYTPDSGIAQQLLQEIDNEFDAMRAAVQRDLSVNELNRREGRQQHAETLAGALYDLPQTRAHEALALAGGLSNLGPQRLQLAMQAVGLGGSPAANFSSLLSLANLNQSAAYMNQQDRAASARALGETIYEILFGGED